MSGAPELPATPQCGHSAPPPPPPAPCKPSQVRYVSFPSHTHCCHPLNSSYLDHHGAGSMCTTIDHRLPPQLGSLRWQSSFSKVSNRRSQFHQRGESLGGDQRMVAGLCRVVNLDLRSRWLFGHGLEREYM
jgi:hypothetical protein